MCTASCHPFPRQALWFKEFLINEGTTAVRTRGGKFVAWVDGDIMFHSPTWAKDTVVVLQRFAVVQPWSTAHLLGPSGETLRSVSSFAAQYTRGAVYGAWRNDSKVSAVMASASMAKTRFLLSLPPAYHLARAAHLHISTPLPSQEYWHPGFAWAARVDAMMALGGLLESTVGSADLHFATALLGAGPSSSSVPPGMDPAYAQAVADSPSALFPATSRTRGTDP